MINSVFCQPPSMSELINEMKKMTETSRFIAGGTDIMVEIYKNSSRADRYISLAKVRELRN